MEKEFKEIGKKMPYPVPEDFFENITEATLEKARLRERSSGKRRLLVQWLAAAALLTGVVFTGIRMLNPPVKEFSAGRVEPLEIATREAIVAPQPGTVVPEETISPGKITNSGGNSVIESPDTPVATEENSESLEDLLASIPDETLKEWGALLNNDPFFEETEDNAQHEND